MGQGRVALGAGDRGPARRPAARRSCWPTCRPTTTRCAPGTPPRTTGRWRPLADARAARTPIEWTGYRPPRPRLLLQQDHDVSPNIGLPGRRPARAGLPERRPRRAPPLHRLAAVLQRLGDEGLVPRHPRRPRVGRDRAQALRGRPDDARPDRRGGLAHRQGRGRAVPGQRRGRRRRGLPRRAARRAARRTPPPAAAGRPPAGRAQPLSGRLRRTQGHRAQGLRRDVRGHRRPRHPRADRAVQGGDRRLLRDPARVAGRPARRGLRRAAARAGAPRAVGLRTRRAPRPARSCSRSSTPASGPRPATRPAPTTPRSRSSGTCSTSRATPA